MLMVILSIGANAMATGKFKLETDPRVPEKFMGYPKAVRSKMRKLRKIVIDTAKEVEGIEALEETLKWGEPSFLAKKGSTLRMDWKAKSPDQYAMYFKCTSRLVDTFREVYPDTFVFDGNRAIVFQLDDVIPEVELKRCIEATLRYHDVKHHPTLEL